MRFLGVLFDLRKGVDTCIFGAGDGDLRKGVFCDGDGEVTVDGSDSDDGCDVAEQFGVGLIGRGLIMSEKSIGSIVVAKLNNDGSKGRNVMVADDVLDDIVLRCVECELIVGMGKQTGACVTSSGLEMVHGMDVVTSLLDMLCCVMCWMVILCYMMCWIVWMM